ncbi:MAG: cobalamin-dependent protein [Lachnospiraceae bacterium]
MKYGLQALHEYLNAIGKIYQNDHSLGYCYRRNLHEGGKNLVGLMFESAGFEVIDLGIDVSERQFTQAIRQHPEAAIVCISSLLTTSFKI